LKQLRLEEAERLLRDTPYKVYEVSSHSGFGDVKYFMKTFRETTGLTPSEWRRKYSK
jgi:two-component system response regulator YesN